MKRSLVVMIALMLVGVGCDATTSASRPTVQQEGLHHVVLDTDLAFDDIMALLYLLRRDDVSIDAVTVTGTGEAHCDPGVRNAQALLALGGSPDTPVACGRETPLDGTNAFPEEWRAAVDDLSVLDLPEVSGEPDPRGAVGLLRDELDGETTLLTLGPLTNVAEALRAEPSLADRVPSFVAMAGAIDVAGNAPQGVAEYNVWADPLAAKEVLEGMAVTLVPLDATNDVPFTPYFADALAQHLGTPEAEAVSTLIDANRDQFMSDGYSFWDTLATTLVFAPGIAAWKEAPVSVTASAGSTAGWIDRDERGTTVRFAAGVPDPLAFEREYLQTITGDPIGALRPDATVTVSFDGRRCALSPASPASGANDVALRTVGDDAVAIAVLVKLGDDQAYRELREVLGPPGSPVPRDDPGLKDVETFAFLGAAMTPVTIPAGSIAALCATGDPSGDAPLHGWLSRPVDVT